MLVAAGALAVARAQPVPDGPQFRVSSADSGPESAADVGVAPDGSFVVVWETSLATPQIRGRRFAADGAPLGAEFAINTFTTGGREEIPAVAVAADGSFVVVWESDTSAGNDDDLTSIQAQRFDAAGDPLGAQFQVNVVTTGFQVVPDVAAALGGGFLVVWRTVGPGGLGDSAIRGRRFDADGLPTNDGLLLSDSGEQRAPAVAAGPGGGFVVVWQRGSTGTEIDARVVATDGTPAGEIFQVNTSVGGNQLGPDVSFGSDGGFVVVWESFGSPGSDDSSYSIQARRFPVEPGLEDQFQVNAVTEGAQRFARVTRYRDGGLLVAWHSFSSAGDDDDLTSIQAQVLGVAGEPLGSQFQVNGYTTNAQDYAAVAGTGDGRFVAAWTSQGSVAGAGVRRIQGRRYRPAAIFADDFESGDSSQWSGAVP